MIEFDIFFNDLKEEVQEDLLKAYKISDLSEGNFDTLPLTTLHIEEM